MKALATSTIAGPSAIQSDVLLNVNNEVKTRIGTTEACSQAMARARKRPFPANPIDLDQLIIQEGFATTGRLNPVRYLLHDNGPVNAVNSRVVFFSRRTTIYAWQLPIVGMPMGILSLSQQMNVGSNKCRVK